MDKERVEMLESLILTSTKPNEKVHRSVVVIDRKHAASYRHGHHSLFKLNEKVILYNLLSPGQHETKIVAISENGDFIVFEKMEGAFENFPIGWDIPYPGYEYYQIGVSSSRLMHWKAGIISQKKKQYLIGSSHEQCDDSGCGIFNKAGLFLGISTGKQRSLLSNLNNMTIDEIASHHPFTKIINSTVLFALAGITDEAKPEEKRNEFDD